MATLGRRRRPPQAQLGGPLEEHQAREVAKHFADTEIRRRDVEEHKRTSAKRERAQEDEAKEKEEAEKVANKEWAEVRAVMGHAVPCYVMARRVTKMPCQREPLFFPRFFFPRARPPPGGSGVVFWHARAADV